jgi:hypothetical protein
MLLADALVIATTAVGKDLVVNTYVLLTRLRKELGGDIRRLPRVPAVRSFHRGETCMHNGPASTTRH